MNKLFSLNRFSPFWMTSFWSVILLAGFLPVVPQPESVIGYLWKVEFAFAAFIFLTLAVGLKFSSGKITPHSFDSRETRFIILPLILFTAWSGFSCAWAESVRGALHHTLLWACYVLFYLLVRQTVSSPKLLDVSLKVVGFVLLALGASCVLEYATLHEAAFKLFTYRYYKFAEIFAAFLPVFAALTLQSKKSRDSFLSAVLAALSWVVVLLSLSRTVFIAAAAGLFVFFCLILLFADWKIYLKKTVALVVLFAAAFFATQSSGSPEKEDSTMQRFNGEYSQKTFSSRFLYWGVAFELFKQKPFAGVGADNYVTAYGRGREIFSRSDEEKELLDLDENVVAERAHNEFLQILTELGALGALIFAWFALGVLRLAVAPLRRRQPQTLLTVGALAGMLAFFVSSLASSYSFRLPANGASFFFLLALAIYGLSKSKSIEESSTAAKFNFAAFDFKRSLAAVGLIICAATLVFSAVRGAGLMYLQNGLSSPEKREIEANFQTAVALDNQDPLIKFYDAIRLYNSERAAEAIPAMRFAIDRGLATSLAYFYLAAAQITAKQSAQAEATLLEALRVYPRSVFLRTFYADFLRRNGRDGEAEIQFEKALKISAPYAESWRVVQTEGMTRLNQLKIADREKYVDMPTLQYHGGIFALLDFQRQNNPELLPR